MKEPLFHLVDKTPVFRGDKLHVHPSYWRQAGAVVTAEFEGETRECGQVVVRSDNGAVPSLPFAALTRNPHPDVADCKAIALLLDCDVHEVSRRDLKLWRASRKEAPATPQAAIPAAPSDAQVIEWAIEEQFLLFCDEEDVVQIVRSAFQKWPTLAALTQPTAVQQADYATERRWLCDRIAHMVLECEALRMLLRRSQAHLSRWQRKYGEHNPSWLPPAGGVELTEDIDAAIDAPRAAADQGGAS